jgi:hypothetical protein
MSEDRCICCGAIIPEGVTVCPSCLLAVKPRKEQRMTDGLKSCEFCKGRVYTKKPVTIITAYGKRFQLVVEYCPNCGRKLRT